MRNNFSVVNVHKKMSEKSEIVTQLLYGETFRKLKKNGTWIKIKNDIDNYQGYIKNKNFASDQKKTHKVSSIFAYLYSKPSEKCKIKKKLSFGSTITATDKKNSFYEFDNFWIKQKDLKKINFKTKNIFGSIYKFINVKYKWGGKHFTGMDCSAIIQLCLNFNNKFCPRDTKDQIKYFRKKVQLENLRKNDLVFWKGHVALVIS